MRLLRAKAARKTLAFYRSAFKLEAPYTVLVDGTFVHHAVSTVQTNLASRVEKVLGRGVRYAVPAAALDELRQLGETCAPSVAFCSRHCEVLGTKAGLGAAEAVLALLAEGSAGGRRFVVATHDASLAAKVRGVAGAPLLRFTGTVLTLDAPSKASLKAAKRSERQRGALDDDERELARGLRAAAKRRRKADAGAGAAGVPETARPKKRASAPNPLSCKKSAKQRNPQPADDGAGERKKKKKRRRKEA